MKASTLVKTEDMALIFDGDGPEEDRTLNITVSPGALTPNREAEIRNADDNAVEPIVDLLLDVIVKWDLLDDKSKVIPLTKASLMDQPIIVLALILNGVTEHLQEKSLEEGKISAATS